MKQKIVIELSLNGQNSSGRGMSKLICCFGDQDSNQATKIRIKAMKTAVSVLGVESAAMDGEERNRLIVIGESIDSVMLVQLLRTNVCSAKIVSVEQIKGESTEEDKDQEEVQPIYYNYRPPYQILELREPYYTPSWFNF